MPCSLAARKWPHSWNVTTEASTKIACSVDPGPSTLKSEPVRGWVGPGGGTRGWSEGVGLPEVAPEWVELM